MKITVLVLSASIFFSEVAQANADKIPIVIADSKGKTYSKAIRRGDYSDKLKLALKAVNESAIEAAKNSQASRQWMMRTFVVGVGIGVEVGVGPILKIKTVPRFRVAFSNSIKPIIP